MYTRFLNYIYNRYMLCKTIDEEIKIYTTLSNKNVKEISEIVFYTVVRFCS